MTNSGGLYPAISTKEELLRRLRQRDVPNNIPTLEPGRELVVAVKRRSEEENLKRIAALKNSLDAAHTDFETQQVFSRLGGFAKSRFSNER